MRLLILSDVDDWDLGPRLTDAGHEIVAWVRNNWHDDRPQGRVYSKIASIARKVLSKGTPAELIVPIFHTPTWLEGQAIPRMTCPNVNDPGFVEQVGKLGIDIVAVCVFPQILKSPVLRAPKMGVINCHPSLLPHYRGPQPTFWMLKNGESMAGVTVHEMTERIDAGNIIAQRAIPILADENAGHLRQRLNHAAAEILAAAIDDLATGSVGHEQPNEGDGSYFGKRRAEDSILDWSAPAREIVDLLRALQPSEPLTARWKGHAIRIYRAHVTDSSFGTAVPGQIVHKRAGRLLVRAGSGSVEVTSYEIDRSHGWINRILQRFLPPIGGRFDVDPGTPGVSGNGTSQARKAFAGTRTRSSV